MNFNKYKSGAGLNKICLQKLFNLLENINNKQINILEFGSGFSTKFLVDYQKYSKKNVKIDTFDNDKKYAYSDNSSIVNLTITNLISCSDNDFELQLNNKKYNRELFNNHKMLPYNHPKFWRQKNCFYDIKQLNKKYDLVIIDGPNGNGRNIAYLHIQNNLNPNCIILIDDYNSKDNDFDYKFIDNLKNIISVQEIYTHTSTDNSWENGGNFAFYKTII